MDAIRNGSALGENNPTELAPGDNLPTFEWRERVLVMPLDKIIKMAKLEWPTHMVVDIDGGEILCLKGMAETLRNPVLRTISIEVDDNTEPEVDSILREAGFIKRAR